MALNSLSGSRCALWPALLHMSWPKPAWFGSPAPAAAKSGNAVNERVVLGRFPLISAQLRSDSGCDLRHRTFQPPPASWGPGHKAVVAPSGALIRARGASGGSVGPGVGAAGGGAGRPAGGPGRAARPSLLEQRRDCLSGRVWGRLGAPVHTPSICAGAPARLPEPRRCPAAPTGRPRGLHLDS